MIETAALVAILALAGYLRLANVTDRPAWYTDEAAHIDIALHQARDDETRYMLVTQSTLLFGRLPLFHTILSQIYRLTPRTDPMTKLRHLTAGLGLLSVLLMYFVGRASGDRRWGLLAALMLAIYPQAVLYSRFGFSYNLLPPLILTAVMGLERFIARKKRRWLALAAFNLGLSLIAEVMALTLIIPFVLAVIFARRARHLPWAAALLFAPMTIYALVMFTSAPEAFGFDLAYTFGRLSSGVPLAQQWETLSNNLITLLQSDGWMLAAPVGLGLLRPARLRWLALLFFLFPIASMGRTVALYHLSAYYMIPLLPFVAMGMASLVIFGPQRIFDLARQARITRIQEPKIEKRFRCAVQMGAVLLILTTLLPSLIRQIDQGFTTDIEPFLVVHNHARDAATYINVRLEPGDTVVASPAVGWQFDANVMDFQMSVAAADHVATPHLPADLPPERLAFDPDYRRARFLVIDNLWRNWGVHHIPGLDRIIQNAESRWKNVFSAGEITVYENPSLLPNSGRP